MIYLLAALAGVAITNIVVGATWAVAAVAMRPRRVREPAYHVTYSDGTVETFG